MTILAAVGALLLSLLAKFLADIFLSAPIPVLGSFAQLRYVLNPGVAFGITFHPVLQWALVTAAVSLVAYAAVRSKTTIQKIAFGVILGGAIGNVIDRIPDGFVTGFFAVGTFPVFNVADSCVTVGVGLLLCESIWMMAGKTGDRKPETRG